MVIRKKPSYAVMTNLYDTIRDLIKDDKFYYTSKEIDKLKRNKSNVFIQNERKTK